ncbi:hypothetical protein PG997_015377 [Apiospora hydei]|uniref:Nucleoside phosphorylase domain-containing protein n=1 Tax=Apiospora hydei TaxID=1337664 RepID=A0ABR1UQF8_9PEZI
MESRHKPGAAGHLQHNDYTVGWVCALSKEQTAATAMLDVRHKDWEQHLRKQPNDTNTYTLGSIGGHNIVIACLPKGKFGTVSAAMVATNMVNTFPSIRFGLMVGIGGAVSRKPPSMLLTALTKLETDYDIEGSKVPEYLKAVGEKNLLLRAKYQKSQLVDRLFKASYQHASGPPAAGEDEMEEEDEDECRHCDPAQITKRKPREVMVVHYGTIASGNQVIKDAKIRDQLSDDLGGNILCVEMEAAGLMDNFPCIVIRGICDYADSHKNDAWQEHAAAVAAAFAKELLGYIQASEVESETPVQETLQAVCNDISIIKDDTAQTRAILNTTADLDALNWLTPVNYGPQHSEYLRRRQPGTGQWFLMSKEYRQWLSSRGKTLFCHGMPGAGKTILASIIVNDLEQRLRGIYSATVVYVYLNFNRKDEQTIECLMSSFLKQLAQTRSPLPKSVTDLYRQHSSRQTKPMLEEIEFAIRAVIAGYSQVFAVIDALDEYQISASSRGQFLSIMSALQAETSMNLLTTARDIPDIWDHFESRGSLHLEVRASEEDITKTDDLKELVISQIVRSVKGMFLLAQLYLESLKDKDTVKSVRQALERMSTPSSSAETTYHHAYEDTMSRIMGQRPSHAQRAMQVLGWAIFAQRPLSKLELRHALGVEPGQTMLDPENLPEISDLVSVCAGLVAIDQESGIISLVHYTAEEYFVDTKEQWFPHFHETILKTCISYLSFESFTSGYCRKPRQLVRRFGDYPFYEYAAKHWGYHARESQTCDAVLQFLQKMDVIEAADLAREVNQETRKDDNMFSFALGRTGLHLAAVFDLGNTVLELLHVYDVNVGDTMEITALELAAERNCLEAVRVLVDNGADLPSPSKALCKASTSGFLEVVRCLTDNVSPFKYGPEVMNNALIRAAIMFFRETCQLLIERGAEINYQAKGIRGMTPLHVAVYLRNTEMAEFLLHQGADANSADSSGRTPLHYTVDYWKGPKMAELLLERGASVNMPDDEGLTPMTQADLNDQWGIVDFFTVYNYHATCPHTLASPHVMIYCLEDKTNNTWSYVVDPHAGRDMEKKFDEPLESPKQRTSNKCNNGHDIEALHLTRLFEWHASARSISNCMDYVTL